MKYLILFIFVISGLLPIRSQSLELMLETSAGNLHNLLTEEQQKSVTSLTLTGSMDQSDFYFIRDNVAKVRTLNLEKVAVDTMPAKALYHEEFTSGPITRLLLPASLKYIGDSAMLRIYPYGQKVTVVFTGQFPQIGRAIFTDDYYYTSEMNNYLIEVSNDNNYCKKEEGSIYSADGKVLYFGGFLSGIKEGTQTIAPRAYYGGFFSNITIPASVKYIGDEAFGNFCEMPVPTMRFVEPQRYIACECTTLPETGKDVFYSDRFHTPITDAYCLYVKEEVLSLYKTTFPWSSFSAVDGWSQIPPGRDGVDLQKLSGLVVHSVENGLEIGNLQDASRLELTNLQGQVICSQEVSRNNVVIGKSELNTSIALLKVTYKDKRVEMFKIKI